MNFHRYKFKKTWRGMCLMVFKCIPGEGYVYKETNLKDIKNFKYYINETNEKMLKINEILESNPEDFLFNPD